MKHFFRFCFYTLLLFVVPVLFGQQSRGVSKKGKDNADFKSFLVVSRLDKNIDFLHKTVLKNISLSSVNKLYKNEYFSVFPVFINVANGEDVVFDLIVRSPENNAVVFHKKGVVANKHLNLSDTVVSVESAFEMCFDNSMPSGQYTALIIAKNLKTSKVSYFQEQFELAEWTSADFTAIEKSKDFWQTLRNYHNSQSPDILCKLFGSSHGQIISNGEINYTLFMFFREALRTKPCLIDLFDKNFDLLDNNTRKNVVMAFASLGDAYRLRGKVLTSEEKLLQDKILTSQLNIMSPYEKVFAGLSTIDLLWGEFYAKGNYAPIERVFYCLDDINSAEIILKCYTQNTSFDNLNPYDVRSGILFISSAYSIMRNASVKLAMSYIDFYVKENPEKFKGNKLKRTFGIVNDYLKIKTQTTKHK